MLATLGCGGRGIALAAPNRDPLSFAPADYTILTPGGSEVIGHARYAIEHEAGGYLLRGENRFLNGERDVDLDEIDFPSPGTVPVLLHFEHSFFNADGSPMLVARADLKSGETSCIRYRRGEAETLAATLDFPTDTYAGASLLIPIEYRLRDNPNSPIRLHAFSCVPGPRLLAVEVRPRAGARWAHHAGEVVAVYVRPKVGWWDLLLEPFIPKIRAWFDPADGFSYVGGELQRFYRGPWVELVRERGSATDEAQKTPP